jgi:hypothetical protein
MKELRESELIAVTGGGDCDLPQSRPLLGNGNMVQILALLAQVWVPQHQSD